MSAVTKISIVLLVVLSLMLSAGLIVFVNRTENFKLTNQKQSAALVQAQSQLKSALAYGQSQASYAEAARAARDSAIADSQKSLATAEEAVANAKSGLADAQGNIKTLQVSLDNLTAVVNASEGQRKAQSDLLDTTRTDNNTLNKKNSDLNLAVSDLTNKLEVATRRVADYQETIAELKSAKESAEKTVADLGGKVGATAGVGAGAPPINGVIRSSRLINGIPYATISVGATDQVVKGMKFNVIGNDSFLGEITIEQVDEREATGKLEGPKVGDVKSGMEVKTQL